MWIEGKKKAAQCKKVSSNDKIANGKILVAFDEAMKEMHSRCSTEVAKNKVASGFQEVLKFG